MKNYNFIFLHLIFLHSIIISQKIIVSEIKIVCSKLQTIISIGHPIKHFYFEFNLQNNISIISNPFYNPLNSLTYQELSKENVTMNNSTYCFSSFQERFALLDSDETFTSVNLTFYSPLVYYGDINNGFSLASQYDNLNYSVLHQFYNKKIINEKKFFFIFNQKNKKMKDMIIFGEIPEYYLESKFTQYKTTFNIDQKFNGWGFTLHSIKIKNYIYEINHYAQLDTSEEDIYTPLDFILYLNETIFNPYLSNGTCFFRNNSGIIIFECKSKYIENFPSVEFYFDNCKLIFNIKKIFQMYEDTCIFKIKPQTNRGKQWDEKKWILGYSFFQDYITEFDYDRKTVTFYSDDAFSFINFGEKQIIHKIYLFLSVLLVSQSIFLLAINLMFTPRINEK